MHVGNLPSTKLIPSERFQSSGMGGFFDSLLTTIGAADANATSVSIANSQNATQLAIAQQQTAQAALAAQASKSSLTPAMMLMIAAGLGGVLFFMRRKRK